MILNRDNIHGGKMFFPEGIDDDDEDDDLFGRLLLLFKSQLVWDTNLCVVDQGDTKVSKNNIDYCHCF